MLLAIRKPKLIYEKPSKITVFMLAVARSVFKPSNIKAKTRTLHVCYVYRH